ncbi:ABC transporter ATP-binding protein [Aneurinibacillus aneurinilyticus]|uniref:Putative bacitracin ABC transporter, ATP-binding protein BcrA n=1 Tax=Aneurinibacillus aneurinilyticus ATCC 12856 TaxID=649747 RepID=U1X0Q9_ANEAE|nr:ABC transporter ATP-binding protein [Aneurinibacillus aneurinilyticus]ERI08108.1 putative bacitracin ABC transporter, ATP-binding protein BcrA [Aneurinibacillus aneurinilyticus ATCC 12856]MED0669087.1 ABC transporter ATP-binding protein [Aneurinibacillus aneurinilyticus]MED0706536.1 ABC transporter ATP-binding protein [Aneurinibacillus aneurinilyticus]MED0724399.1 ABC transporter ATP-binding protein [Aneurinibacillus aneurinilyticus]MED0730546.1 ABC transporter ATP-binding protein [Aneurini
MVSEQTIIQIRNLTKKIGRKKLVDSLTFDIKKGEVFGFLGPNGAGKTTTIRMIVGLMSITKGEVIIEGKSIAHEFEQAIQHVGAIVENPEMYKFLTGYQNLVHFANMVPGGIKKERIKEVIKLVGLESRIHDKVKTYSLGMRQRLGVAQALLHKPSVLILDEPTNGLDPSGIRELRDYLRSLAQNEGVSVIVSSHLLSEMELMCDRIAIIQNGKLIDVKRITELVQNNEEEITVMFTVAQSQIAIEQVKKYMADAHISMTETGFQITIERERIPDIITLLADNCVRIYEVKHITKTLEDKFLEMTEGEKIV